MVLQGVYHGFNDDFQGVDWGRYTGHIKILQGSSCKKDMDCLKMDIP